MPICISPERLAEGLEGVRASANGRAVSVAAVLPALIGGTIEDVRLYEPERLAELAAAGVFGDEYSITEATSADTSPPSNRATR